MNSIRPQALPSLLLLSLLLSLSFSRFKASQSPDFFLVNQNSDCSAPLVLSSANKLPSDFSGIRQLTVDAIFNVNSQCPGTSTPMTLFALTQDSPDLLTRKSYFNLLVGISNALILKTQDDTLSYQQKTISSSLTSAFGQYEFLGSIDLMNSKLSAQLIPPDGKVKDVTFSEASNFFPASEFNSLTKIFICTNPDLTSNSANFACEVKSLRLWYTYFTQDEAKFFLYEVYPNILGQYQMISESTSTITDSQGTLDPIAIGESSGPTWDSTEKVGYTFSETQTVHITNFLLPENALASKGISITVNFWLKVDNRPSTMTALFQYYMASTQKMKFTLALTPDLKTEAMINLNPVTISSAAISLGSWRLITACFRAGSLGGLNFARIYFESSLVASMKQQATTTSIGSPRNDDMFQLGGPGTIYNMRIFSPGSKFVLEPTDTSSPCFLYLGYETPETCLWELSCAETHLCKECQGDMCASCFLGFEDSFSGCKECPAGQYLSTTEAMCKGCPVGCKTCNSEIDCPTCEENYVPLNGHCSKLGCPSNPECYLYTEDKTCRPECSYPNLVITVSPTERLCSLDIDPSDYEQVKSLVNGAQAGGTTSGVVGLLMSLVDSANPSAFTMASITKMLQYMKFLRIKYPPKLYLMLLLQKTASGGLNFVPEMSESMKEDIPDKQLPMQFEIHKVHSNFLVGFWQPLISMIILLGIIGVLYLIETNMQDYKSFHSVVTMISPHIKWNLFLMIFCSNYCDLAFYTAVSFMSANFESGVAVLGFLICLLLNTLAFFLIVFMIQIIVSLRTARSHNTEAEVRKQNQNYKMVFEVFKDQTFLQQSFVIFFSIRAYLYSAVVGFLYNHPVVQAVLLLLLCVIMLAYLFVKRPMKILINYVQQIFCELVLLSVNLCVLIMTIIDQQDPVDHSKKEGFGTFIILMNILISWTLPVFTVIKVILIIKEQLTARKPTKHPNTSIKTEGEDTVNMTTLQTNTAVSTRKLPRVQMPNRPIPTLDHDLSTYQINENETSVLELTKNYQNTR